MSRSGKVRPLRRSSPNRDPDRGGDRPRAIVVHTTDGQFRGDVGAGSRAPKAGSASHYLVGLDGRSAQFVDEADTARHAGRVLEPTARIERTRGRRANRFTIGIEFEDGGDPLGGQRAERPVRAGAQLTPGRMALGHPAGPPARTRPSRDLRRQDLPGQPRPRALSRGRRELADRRRRGLTIGALACRHWKRGRGSPWTFRVGRASPTRSSRSTTAAPTRPGILAGEPSGRDHPSEPAAGPTTPAGTTAPTASGCSRQRWSSPRLDRVARRRRAA